MSYLMQRLRQLSFKNIWSSFERTFASDINDAFSDVTLEGTQKLTSYPVLTGERSVNKVTLIGRLGKNPEMRGTPENPVVLFSVATSLTLKNPEGDYLQKTDWHRVAIFRPKMREWAVSTLAKGDRVYVSGAIRYGSFQDKITNQQVRAVSIIADDIVSLMKHSEGRNTGDSPPPEETETGF